MTDGNAGQDLIKGKAKGSDHRATIAILRDLILNIYSLWFSLRPNLSMRVGKCFFTGWRGCMLCLLPIPQFQCAWWPTLDVNCSFYDKARSHEVFIGILPGTFKKMHLSLLNLAFEPHKEISYKISILLPKEEPKLVNNRFSSV